MNVYVNFKLSCKLSREQLREMFDLWQSQGYTGQRNMGTFDDCNDYCANRHVGKEKTYWVCAVCNQRFGVWQIQEMSQKEESQEAARILLLLSQQVRE